MQTFEQCGYTVSHRCLSSIGIINITTYLSSHSLSYPSNVSPKTQSINITSHVCTMTILSICNIKITARRSIRPFCSSGICQHLEHQYYSISKHQAILTIRYMSGIWSINIKAHASTITLHVTTSIHSYQTIITRPIMITMKKNYWYNM